MPRQLRIVVPGVPHHVVLRGNNRRRLFSNNADRLFWLQCLDRAMKATHCALHQNSLMTNHTHLIVTPPTIESLPTLVKRACQRYAQCRNDRLNASGKLFEQRYYSEPVADETHLLYTLLYNDANAYRAGMVDDPTEHRWSTGPLHAARDDGKFPASMWTPLVLYTRLGRSREQRAEAYRRLMAAYLQDPAWIPYDDGASEPRYRQRIERPDGTSAREPELVTQWRRKAR
jgi:putative transposase